MPDALTTITKLIQSPPGQLAAGGVLAGIVWKFFERVEAVLTDETKLEIAIWLVGVKLLGPKVEPWPETFAKLFDRVFGTKHLSWKCFFRSCVATVISCIICSFLAYKVLWDATLTLVVMQTGRAAVPLLLFDYLSLLESRYVLRLMRRWRSVVAIALLLLLDFGVTGALGVLPSALLYGDIAVDGYTTYKEHRDTASRLAGLSKEMAKSQLEIERRSKESQEMLHGLEELGPSRSALLERARAALEMSKNERSMFAEQSNRLREKQALNELNSIKLSKIWEATKRLLVVLWLPAFFTSIWLWLYAGAGFLLKFARRFDIGFEWFNRKFDIEKKPLQSIGFVAGALVAVAYWAAVIVSRIVG
jgi:hypothetical protein